MTSEHSKSPLEIEETPIILISNLSVWILIILIAAGGGVLPNQAH